MFRRSAESPFVGGTLVKRGVLLFWAAWITIVVVANVATELKALGLLRPLWPLASGNFRYILKETSIYSVPWWIDQILFLGAVACETAGAALFWRAVYQFWAGSRRRLRAAYTAHAVLLALFAAFILADEVFHDFRIEGDHRGIFMLLLVSLVAITLLPEE